VVIYLYGFEVVSYFLAILNVSLSYALYRSRFLFVLSRSRAIVLEIKFIVKLKKSSDSNEFENSIENKIQTKLKNK
jgi:hypothetical protein